MYCLICLQVVKNMMILGLPTPGFSAVCTHTHTPAQLGGGGYMCIMLLTSGLARNVAVDWLVSQFMLPHLFTAYIYSQIPASTQLTLYSLSAGS